MMTQDRVYVCILQGGRVGTPTLTAYVFKYVYMYAHKCAMYVCIHVCGEYRCSISLLRQCWG